MSFQDELKNSIKTKEEAEQSVSDKITAIAEYEAKRLIKEIKSALIAKAKVADYQTINGTTVVTCTCPLPLRYLCKRRLDNNAQIIANNRKLLFKNRNLVYQTWYICEIAPQYEEEYKRLTNILRSLASEDKIDINFVICEKREKKIYPFPSQIEGFHLDCDLILSVEAQSRV